MKLGLVDLDTSHPQNWVPIERALGYEIIGVWDGGTVHPAGYAARFAREQGIPHVYGTPAEMISEVDCVVIHSCNWDTHIPLARPFIEAGVAVLIDKPLAGNVRDLQQLRTWAAQGARIAGGSSLRFCAETRAWLALPIAERGTPHTALCGCAVDEFNYGIHAYAMLLGILGPGVRSAQHLSQGVQRRICLNWTDGRMGLVIIGQTAAWMPFYATIVTERTVAHYQAAPAGLYRSLLEATLPYLSGEALHPMPMEALLEPELCALAARRSWLEGDREVAIAELHEEDDGYNGAAFAERYRKARYS